MRDLAELNINEGGEPVERPAPTAGQIEAFERAFGVKLPDDYLTLLRHANGGSPEVDSIDPAEGGEVASWAVDHFLFLTDNRDSLEGLWSQAKAWGKVLGPGVIPIGIRWRRQPLRPGFFHDAGKGQGLHS